MLQELSYRKKIPSVDILTMECVASCNTTITKSDPKTTIGQLSAMFKNIALPKGYGITRESLKSLYDHSFDGDIDFAALSVITDILSKGIILSHWADAHTIVDKTSVIAAPIEINNERYYAVLISGKKKSEFKYPYVMRVFSDAYIKDELLNIYRTSPQGVTTSRQNADFQKFAANLLINYILNNSDLSFLTTNSTNTQNNDNNPQPINCNRNMNTNRINEIGDTTKGQEMLGRTAERAYQRANRTSGADKNRYMKTYNDAYRTGGKSANKHLGGSREHFDNGRDYEYEKWADEHNGNVTESKNMNRKLIRLTESDLHNIVRESVNRTLEEISEGSAFSHSNDEWGKDYFVNAKALARGIYDILKAMEDEGNSNDYRSTTYLYHELERRVIELNQTYKLIKHYISGFKQPQAQP